MPAHRSLPGSSAPRLRRKRSHPLWQDSQFDDSPVDSPPDLLVLDWPRLAFPSRPSPNNPSSSASVHASCESLPKPASRTVAERYSAERILSAPRSAVRAQNPQLLEQPQSCPPSVGPRINAKTQSLCHPADTGNRFVADPRRLRR